jgi:hypothetical protein
MKKYVNSIDKHIEKGVSFSNIAYLVEMFPSPIPKEINGIKIHTAKDLFRMSNATGLFELYIPDSTSITGEAGGKKIKFSRDDFIAWQLLRIHPSTILWLASKIDADLSQLSEYDPEFEKLPNYNPEDWLNPHNSGDITTHGCSFIERIKATAPGQLCELMTSALLGEKYGVMCFWETEIHDDIKPIRKLYKDWDEPLMVISCGNFYPYIEAGDDTGLLMDDYRLREMFVRNYDEGDI